MASKPERKPGQQRLEKNNPDRVKFQRGKKVRTKSAPKRRRKPRR